MNDKFGLHSAYHDQNSLMSKKMETVSNTCEGGETLLDIGCGTGEFISRVRSKFESVVGIDLDDSLLRYSKNRFASDNKIKILRMGIEKITALGRGTFDCVSALDIIEHLDDPIDALGKIFSILKPGGQFLMTTPNWPDKIYIRLDPETPHRSAHSSFGWLNVVKKSGFEIEYVGAIRFPIIDSEFLRKKLHLFGMCVFIVSRKLKS